MSESVRALVKERIKSRDLNMAEVSRKIGRNHAYIQQFIDRGVPRTLNEGVREKLAPILGLQPDDLRSSELAGDAQGPAPARGVTGLAEARPVFGVGREDVAPEPAGTSHLINFDLLRRAIAGSFSIHEGKPFDAERLARKALQLYRDEEAEEAGEASGGPPAGRPPRS